MEDKQPELDTSHDGYLNRKAFHIDSEPVDNETLALRFQDDDAAAAAQLLSNNERFLNDCAADLCNRYGTSSIADDLKQEGALALLDAAKKYSADENAKFITYAFPAVKSAMLDFAASASLPLKLTSSRYNQLRRVLYILANAPAGTKETAHIEKIEQELSVSAKTARALLLEQSTIFLGEQLGTKVFELSFGGDPAVLHTQRLRQEHIDELLETLTPRERMVVQKHCGFNSPSDEGMTFEEMAVRLNFNSPSAAEKAFKRAVKKLRDSYGKIGSYGSWRTADKAFQNAKRACSEPAPTSTWYEEEWKLTERFPVEILTLLTVEAILRDILETDMD